MFASNTFESISNQIDFVFWNFFFKKGTQT